MLTIKTINSIYEIDRDKLRFRKKNEKKWQKAGYIAPISVGHRLIIIHSDVRTLSTSEVLSVDDDDAEPEFAWSVSISK